MSRSDAPFAWDINKWVHERQKTEPDRSTHKDFSRQTATSYIKPQDGFCPAAFEAQSTAGITVGIAIGLDQNFVNTNNSSKTNNVQLNRIFRYDVGSQTRPYRGKNQQLLLSEFKTKKEQGQVFETLIALQNFNNTKKSIKKSTDEDYNEVMARLQWNANNFAIAFFNEKLPSKLLAIIRAYDAKERLANQQKSLGRSNPDIQLPSIVYYAKNSTSPLKKYTPEDQIKDITKALNSNKQYCKEMALFIKLQQHNFD